MRFALLSCACMLVAGVSACVVPGTERMHGIGDSDHMFLDTNEYRAVDNAIYDTLVERYGANAVQRSAYPEKEYHHWYVHTPEYFNGGRSRTRVEGNPFKTSDGGYEAEIRVKHQTYLHSDPGQKPYTNTAGENRWFEGGRDHKLEAEIMNSVNEKLAMWRADGRGDTGNRRDDYDNSNLNSSQAGGQ